MMDLQGIFVRSAAGHDKNQVFFILREDAEYVYLVDGKYRTLNHPKKKKRKHVIPLEALPESSVMEVKGRITDEAVKHAIKQYAWKSPERKTGL